MIEVAKAMQHSGRISGATKLIGLIGSPVQNSGSPKIHNAVFEHLGLDYAYIAFDVDNDRLEDTVRGMAAMGFLGYNVTTPCKTFVLPFLDEVSEAAEIMGAVNTVVRGADGRLTGYNTDFDGFSALCAYADVPLRGRRVLILGSGGTAQTVRMARQRGLRIVNLAERQLSLLD